MLTTIDSSVERKQEKVPDSQQRGKGKKVQNLLIGQELKKNFIKLSILKELYIAKCEDFKV